MFMVPTRQRGLTLVELLVALSVLALLALLGWRALDAMVRTRQIVAEHSQHLQGWQTVVAQWRADLDAAIVPEADAETLTWNTGADAVWWVRRAVSPDVGWQVVAWGMTDDGQRWSRWLSPPFSTRDAWHAAWQNAPQRLRDAGVRTVAVAGWQLQAWRDGAWQAVGGAFSAPALRLTLTPATDSPWPGPLIIDWVAPQVAGGKQ